ncbi:ankyrin repeat domain-containing protein 39-like [Anneissia japonica]|uniref:ankyrin repeat domain-containing protein 39-like n=1 Tax=Anneissia japonica TaxID=1529436 RepID=UPI00142559CC|nr:ankyrin repeat domain-containing protein 39-like [Anneissia japonica]XP_033100498.1 ankyrin repeat domain-containing protein 39-like [Anneissia japonica]
MSSKSNHHTHHDDGSEECSCHDSHGVSQSLGEMDFERGIWSAALYNDYERIKKLLKNTPVDKLDATGYTALHYSSRSGHLAICCLLLDNGAQPNARTRAGGVTPLHRSACCGHLDVVKELLKRNANPLILDEDGKSPLHKAAEGGFTDVCKSLLEAQPSLLEIEDKRRKLAWQYASDVILRDLLHVQ